jgi:hypothetical protein
MNIWNKVFLGVIMVAALAVLALAAVELNIRNAGQKKTYVELQQRIEETESRIARINEGTATELGFNALQVALSERLNERGRAWFGCRVAGPPVEETLPPALNQVIVQVLITSPLAAVDLGAQAEVVFPEHLMGVVHVFVEGEQAGEIGPFLGRFTVDSVPTAAQFRDDDGNQIAGYRVTLITADPVGNDEIELIFDATGSRWAIFLAPPIDRYAGIFDNLTEEQRQMIPPDMLDRFQPRPMPPLTEAETEGVPANVLAVWEAIRAKIDDPQAGVARDYTTMLDWLYEQLSMARRDIHGTDVDIKIFQEAKDRIDAENIKLRADGDLELKRVAAMEIQRDASKILLEQYQEEVNNLVLQIEKQETLNEFYVAKLAEYQALAVEIIDGQAVANADEGGE